MRSIYHRARHALPLPHYIIAPVVAAASDIVIMLIIIVPLLIFDLIFRVIAVEMVAPFTAVDAVMALTTVAIIIARAALAGIIASIPLDRIVARAALEHIVAAATDQRVIANSTHQRHRNRKRSAGAVEMNIVIPLATQGTNFPDVRKIKTFARSVHRHHDAGMRYFNLDIIGPLRPLDGQHSAVQ